MRTDSLNQIVWYRIGQMIHFYGQVWWTSHSGGASGTNFFEIEGLPYQAVDIATGAEFLTGNWVANQYIGGVDGNVSDGLEQMTYGAYVTEGTPKIRLAAFYGIGTINVPGTELKPGGVSHVLVRNENMQRTGGRTSVNGWYFATQDSIDNGLAGTGYQGTVGPTVEQQSAP